MPREQVDILKFHVHMKEHHEWKNQMAFLQIWQPLSKSLRVGFFTVPVISVVFRQVASLWRLQISSSIYALVRTAYYSHKSLIRILCSKSPTKSPPPSAIFWSTKCQRWVVSHSIKLFWLLWSLNPCFTVCLGASLAHGYVHWRKSWRQACSLSCSVSLSGFSFTEEHYRSSIVCWSPLYFCSSLRLSYVLFPPLNLALRQRAIPAFLCRCIPDSGRVYH